MNGTVLLSYFLWKIPENKVVPEKIIEQFLDVDLSELSLDTSIVQAHQHSAGKDGQKQVDATETEKEKQHESNDDHHQGN